MRSQVSKSEAIEIVNVHEGSKLLNNRNRNFSSINVARPVWWFNINPDRFKNELHLLLAKPKGGFIWINIPEGRYREPQRVFRIRSDKNLVDLEISTEPGVYYLRDIKSGGTGFDFKPYVVKEF